MTISVTIILSINKVIFMSLLIELNYFFPKTEKNMATKQSDDAESSNKLKNRFFLIRHGQVR